MSKLWFYDNYGTRILICWFMRFCPVLGKIRLKIVNGRILENGSLHDVENTILKLFRLMQFCLIPLSLWDKIENLRLMGFYPRIGN